MYRKLIVLFTLFTFIFTLAPGPLKYAEAATYGSRTLRLGSVGSDVKLLEAQLRSLGYFKIQPNNNYNAATKAAVTAFQKRYKLKANGIASRLTISKIKTAYTIKARKVIQNSKVKALLAKKQIVLGYTAVDYTNDNYSYNSVNSFSTSIDSISTFSHLIDASGNLSGVVPKTTVDLANQKNIAPFLLIHNYKGGFDRQLARNFLRNAQSRKNLINKVLPILRNNGYLGVNVDIENVYPADRPYYTAFIRELSSALHNQGLLVVASIPAKVRDITNDGWSGGFDYLAIGKAVDFVQIMTYDEHWFGGTPGPIASINWVNNVSKYVSQTMPKSKVLLGIASYGYDWSSTKTKALPLRKIGPLVEKYGGEIQWDNTAKVPFYKYNDGTADRVAWFENENSTQYKLNLVKNYGFRGIGIWRLGFETPAFWQTVDKNL